MKNVKRLLALLLTLILALSCATVALAARSDDDYMLTQFEITVPQLPSTSNTVADVMGTTSPTAVPAEVTYNNGKTDLTYAESFWRLHIFDPVTGNNLNDSDSFTAGKRYTFAFATFLPRGMDIDNSLIFEDDNGNVRLDLPVYINGTKSDYVVIFYHPDSGQMSVNASYTVPAPTSPAPTSVFMDTFDVQGLKLPEPGLTVRESLARVSVKGMSLYDAEWRTGDSDFRELAPTEKFEAGKTYALVVSVQNDGITYRSDSNGNAIMTPLMDGKPLDGGLVIGGRELNSLPTLNWRYTVPKEDTVPANALKEIHIDGLVAPVEGMKVSDTYANVKVYYDTPGNTKEVTAVLWQEITPDGHTIELTDNDRFEQGKRYFLSLDMKYSGEPLHEHPDPGIIMTWVVADVYVNGQKVYTGAGNEQATLVLYENLRFSNYYTCPAPANPTPGGSFSDVDSGAWYAGYVSSATEMGLINGMTPTSFEPEGNLTLAQAVKLAACMNQLYTEGKVTLQNGDPWYQSYAQYARDQGIINRKNDADGISYDDVMKDANRVVTRQEYAWIFARALPEKALPAVNTIPDGSIPDVKCVGSTWGQSIYALYRAGIVNGSDTKGTFNPDRMIKRSEVAAIVVRMMDPTARVPAPTELGK